LGTHHGRSVQELVERRVVNDSVQHPSDFGFYTKYGSTYTAGIQRIGNFADMVS